MKNKLVGALPILHIVFGILIIIFKGEVLKWMAISLGAYLLLYSLVSLFFLIKHNKNRNLIPAYIVSSLIGILIIVCGALIVTLIRVFIGILVILDGVFSLYEFSRQKIDDNVEIIGVINAVLLIVIGVLLFIDSSILYYFVGALLVLNGILSIIRKGVKKHHIKIKNENIIAAEVNEI